MVKPVTGEIHGRERATCPLPRPLSAARLPLLEACPPAHPGRERLEQYIATVFQAAWDARVLSFLPLLCSLQQSGHFSAALGLRSANHGPLFCEQYLARPALEEVEALYGGRCLSGSLMELGNLAASHPGQGALLYLLVTAAIHDAGIRYLIFAANRAVRVSIRRSGFTPLAIGPARPECLGTAAASWGRYYEGDPVVMAGDMVLTRQQVLAQPELTRVLHEYRASIDVLTSAIREHCA
jgi:hypothetical protein